MSTAVKASLIFLAFAVNFLFHNDTARAFTSKPLSHFLHTSETAAKRNQALCFAYEDLTPGLPCNPAFLGFRREAQFWLYGYGNNNLEYFQDVADIVNGPIQADELLPIIDHNSNEHFQFGSSLGFVSDNWGFSIIPAKLLLFTHIRNPALPRITLLAAREEEVQFQVGSVFDPEWSWGLQLRGVHRRFSYSDAYFSDHFTDDMDHLYDIRNQSVFYLEPSLIFAPENQDWNPMFSLMVTNLGNADHEFEPYHFNPTIQLGGSISSDLEYGHLKSGVVIQSFDLDNENKLYSSFGLTYSFSYLQIFTTLGELEQSYGLAFNSRYFTTGLSYSEQDWSEFSTQSDSKLWRWDFGFQF